MSIGEKIKQLRIIYDLTQKQLANKIGVKASTISKYENGERKVPFDTITKIAIELHADLEYFIDSNESTNFTFVAKNISETTLYKFIALYEVEKKNNPAHFDNNN